MKNLLWLFFFCTPFFTVAQDLDEDLVAVNELCIRYNTLGISFDYSIAGSQLIFGTITDSYSANVNAIKISIDSKNNLVISCTDGKKCMLGLRDDLASYSISLRDAKGPRVADVKTMQKLLEQIIQFVKEDEVIIEGEITEETIPEDDYTAIDLNKTTIAEDLAFVNEQLDWNNADRTSFSMDEANKTITIKNAYSVIVVKAELIDIRLHEYGHQIVIVCKDGSDCLILDNGLEYSETGIAMSRNVRNTRDRLRAAQRKLLR
jgi:hypothetical protein